MIILTLSEAVVSAPLSRSSLTDSVFPLRAANMRGVSPFYMYKRRQDNKDTNTTQSSVISCCVL